MLKGSFWDSYSHQGERNPELALKEGEMAPLFEGISDSGEKFSLANLIGKTNVVLYFYPKDETYGCTKEACAFRNEWSKLATLGATVVGVSSDSAESHRSFKEHHSLPFILVSDENQEIRKKYGVAKGKFIPFPPRVTFVIERDGRIAKVFNSQIDFDRHVEEALSSLQKIGAKGKDA
jgi:peroxiredoxin Q/BCP